MTHAEMAEATGLTPRQLEILRFIARHVVDEGRPPSIRETMGRFGISAPNGIVCHLQALRKKGWLTWSGGEAKSVRLTGAALAIRYEDTDQGRRLALALGEITPATPAWEGAT